MTDQSSPIRPPFHLLQQWREKWNRCPIGVSDFHIAIQAAQWGSDQRGAINEAMLQERADKELEACCEWFADASNHGFGDDYAKIISTRLRAARRPKPPSLKEQALEGFERVLSQLYSPEARKELEAECKTILLALEGLPND
jgi:hypothetical protein